MADGEGGGINVILASSPDYLPYSAVTIASVCHHLGEGRRADFHILHDGQVSGADENRFRDNLARFADRAAISFVKVEDRHGLAERLTTSRHIAGSATYHRLYIPDIFGKRFSRVLYLDSDLVVCRDLTELFHSDLGDCRIAGVEDTVSLSNLRSLCLPETSKYVNGGVLLWNLRKISAAAVADRLQDLITGDGKHIIKSGDQDLIALLFHDRTHYLDPAWNVLAKNSPIGRTFIFRRCQGQNRHTREGLAPGYADPAIIHYIGSVKPWHANWYYDPLTRRWFAYARLVGYYGAAWERRRRLAAALWAPDRVWDVLNAPFSWALGRGYRAFREAAVRFSGPRPGAGGRLAEEKNALLSKNAALRSGEEFHPD
ncbi:MAG: glycosyltransferase family 8 protein, partial [Planctomycetes bacterium]|nr:glycosyltransferase family 8 protein [Planctomycetota bacterium]